MTNDEGRKPGGAPERSPKAGEGAPSGVDGNGPKRFSVQRKMAIVARLLRGESDKRHHAPGLAANCSAKRLEPGYFRPIFIAFTERVARFAHVFEARQSMARHLLLGGRGAAQPIYKRLGRMMNRFAMVDHDS